jgi:hypothetical protein
VKLKLVVRGCLANRQVGSSLRITIPSSLLVGLGLNNSNRDGGASTVLMSVLRERAKSLIPNMAAGKKQAVSTNRSIQKEKKS